MSKTIKGSKGPGYDYWSRRKGNRCGNACPSKRPGPLSWKRWTNRAERRTSKQSLLGGDGDEVISVARKDMGS